MKLVNLFFLSISGLICLILINSFLVKINFVERTKIALEDYSMLPDYIEVKDKAILGRGSDRYRSGAISLICTNQSNVLLLIQDRKSTNYGKVGFSREGFFSGSNNITSNNKHTEMKISNITYLFRGYFDIFISDPLSKQEISSILEILRIEDLNKIKINIIVDKPDSLGITSNSFNVNLDMSEVELLINGC